MYFGMLLNNKKNGLGYYLWDSGDVYFGRFIEKK